MPILSSRSSVRSGRRETSDESGGTMGIDVLILNSGSWTLAEELPASPWHVLIYRQSREPRNELHLWLPRQDARRTGDFACKRYWMDEGERWCVEAPATVGRPRGRVGLLLRFTAADGRALWAEHAGGKGIADLSDYDLSCLLARARPGSFSGA